MGRTPITASNDPEWMAGLRAGRTDAFRALYDAHMVDLWRFARRFVPSDIAEDIVHDVMADLWRRRTTVEVRGTLTQYLFGAVYHRVMNYRKRERMIESVEHSTAKTDPLGMGAAAASPEEQAVATDLRSALVLAMNRLSQTQRSVLELRWLHEMKYEQIADVLGISVDAASQHVSRAQRVIRPILRRFLDTE